MLTAKQTRKALKRAIRDAKASPLGGTSSLYVLDPDLPIHRGVSRVYVDRLGDIIIELRPIR